MGLPSILAAAFSARQIAESAALAGYDTLAVDFFGDLDTLAAARRAEVLRGHYPDGFTDTDLMAALDRLAEGENPVGFVYGAGFEDRPALLKAIGARWPILGNGADRLRIIKTPERFAALCAEAGVAHPAIRRTPPDDPDEWLAKAQGGCGGSHIRPASGLAAEPGRYFQRRVAGESWSMLFVANGARAGVVGFSRQWHEPGDATAPYRYGGAVGPLDPPDGTGPRMRAALERFLARQPLSGMGSADFRLTAEGPVLLEINPRAGATIDVFDGPLTGTHSVLGRHLDAVLRSREPAGAPAFSGSVRACGLAWADANGLIPSDFAWPAGTRDRSDGPLAVAAGQPICTVVAEARTAGAAETEFHRRVAAIRAMIGKEAA